jgi:hypothetical protein
MTPRSRDRAMRMRQCHATSIAKHNQMKEPEQHIWTRRRGGWRTHLMKVLRTPSSAPISLCLSPNPLRAHHATPHEAFIVPCARLPPTCATLHEAAGLDPHHCTTRLLHLPCTQASVARMDGKRYFWEMDRSKTAGDGEFWGSKIGGSDGGVSFFLRMRRGELLESLRLRLVCHELNSVSIIK